MTRTSVEIEQGLLKLLRSIDGRLGDRCTKDPAACRDRKLLKDLGLDPDDFEDFLEDIEMKFAVERPQKMRQLFAQDSSLAELARMVSSGRWPDEWLNRSES